MLRENSFANSIVEFYNSKVKGYRKGKTTVQNIKLDEENSTWCIIINFVINFRCVIKLVQYVIINYIYTV